MTAEQITALRAAVAQALSNRGHGNPEFLRQIREGEQDDGPYMTGAVAGWRLATGEGDW